MGWWKDGGGRKEQRQVRYPTYESRGLHWNIPRREGLISWGDGAGGGREPCCSGAGENMTFRHATERTAKKPYGRKQSPLSLPVRQRLPPLGECDGRSDMASSWAATTTECTLYLSPFCSTT